MQKIKELLERIFPCGTRRVLKFSFIFTFVFGFAAHGYCFLNGNFRHDNLVIYAELGEELWKLRLGRYLVPVYRLFRGGLSLPLFIGIISLVWISLAVYFCCRFFGVSKLPTVAAFSAVMAVNITVISQAASYLYELDFDMFALLCSVLAACCWKRGGKAYWLTPVFVFVSLGIYQAYLAVTVTLMMLYSIIALAKEEDTDAKKVVVKGLKGIAALLMGAVIYALGLLLLSRVLCVTYESGTSNSLTNLLTPKSGRLLSLLRDCYVFVIERLFAIGGVWMKFLRSSYPVTAVCAVLLALVPAVILALKLKKKIKPLNFVLICVLGALLPLGVNFIWILADGTVHYLMCFAFWFIWLLPLLIIEMPTFEKSFKGRFKNIAKVTVAFCLALMVFTHIQTANAAYVRQDLIATTTSSVLTDVRRIMSDTDGYIAGETEVMFVGDYNADIDLRGFVNTYGLAGLSSNLSVTYAVSYSNYFRYYFNEYISAVEPTEKVLESAEYKAMPCYPDRGCVGYIDDVLVVKFDDWGSGF